MTKLSLRLFVSSLLVGAVFVGCGGGDDSGGTTQSNPPSLQVKKCTPEVVVAGKDLICPTKGCPADSIYVFNAGGMTAAVDDVTPVDPSDVLVL